MGSMSVSSCRCCRFVSCVHPVAVLNSECNVVSLYVVCCSVNVSVCFVCCVLDSVREMFVKTILDVWVWLLFCC